ncbi:MAG TPA: hypothetical protein VFU76_08685, partial [Terriglobales bacterium]|nr:hypothetical protein [Terriglobales bacterium]
MAVVVCDSSLEEVQQFQNGIQRGFGIHSQSTGVDLLVSFPMQHISAWLQNPIIIQAIAAVVQTATAIVIVVLTAKLVSSTRHYADLTRQSLEISRKQ